MHCPDPDPVLEQRHFEARMASVPRTAEFAQEICDRHRLPQVVALRLTLVLEELFSNTVTHGHRGDSDATVRIALGMGLGGLRVVYEDEAPAFDPVAAAARGVSALDMPAHQRGVGRLGLPLALGMGHDLRYARVAGRNRIELTIVDDPGTEPGRQRAPNA